MNDFDTNLIQTWNSVREVWPNDIEFFKKCQKFDPYLFPNLLKST